MSVTLPFPYHVGAILNVRHFSPKAFIKGGIYEKVCFDSIDN